MDIFLGSNRPIDQEILRKAHHMINQYDMLFALSTQNNFCVWKNDDYLGEVTFFQDLRFQIIFDGYLNNLGMPMEEYLPILANRIIEKKCVLLGKESGIFNIAVIDRESKNVYLASDPGALFPLYYLVLSGNFIFFSHMYIFASVLDLSPDLTGVLTKLKFGYTLGSRTLYRSLFRINPGEIIEFDDSGEKIKIHKSEHYYSKYIDFGKQLLPETWNCLNSSISAMPLTSKRIGVMLSEGFDSRLIAGLFSKNGNQILTYTHGSSMTKGSQITFKVAQSLSSDYHFNPLEEGLPPVGDSLRRQLFLSDNLSVPYWIYANDYFSRCGVDRVSAGSALDSTLGGHAFFRPQRPRIKAVIQRYDEIIKQDFGLLNDSYVEELSIDLLNIFERSCLSSNIQQSLFNYVNRDLISEFDSSFEEVNADFKGEILRVGENNLFPSQILLRLYLENRARKYSFGQELTLRINNKVIFPSYEQKTMRVLSSIHPKYKLQHKLYLSIVRNYLPDLFRIPNGGFGLPVKWPRLILESSRFIHKYFEEKSNLRYLQEKGNLDINRLRPVNYIESTYRKGNAVDSFIEFFEKNDEIFNSKSLVEDLVSVKNYQKKSFPVMDAYRLYELFYPLSRL